MIGLLAEFAMFAYKNYIKRARTITAVAELCHLANDSDLYCVGEDEMSAADIDDAVSQVDIIRADGGSFKGQAARC